MKKKLFLLVAVVAVLAVVLSGCISKPPHKMFSDPWGDYEQITYDVTRKISDDVTINGSSTLTTERLTNADITIGEREIKGFSGTVVTIDTSLEDGSTMIGKVAFKTSFEPVASYKNIQIKGHEGSSPAKDIAQTTNIFYNDEKCNYSTNFDGVKTEDSIKVGAWLKKPFYDNLMLYHIARSSYLNGNFSSLTAKVLSTGDFTMKTLTVSIVSSNQLVKMENLGDSSIKADLVKISLNQTFPGSGAPMTVALSREVRTGDESFNGMNFSVERIPMVITEGDMTYKIKAYSTTRQQ